MVNWNGAPGMSAAEIEARKDRFRILVCIDGSDECYQSLRYAARLGGGVDADIVLLYVRPTDQGLRSGGLQVRVARENMLKWGLELPGIQYLKKGRDMLKELGIMAGDEWREEVAHTDVNGDPLGDNKINYINEQGKMVVLKLKVATDIATGILEQWEFKQMGFLKRSLYTYKWEPILSRSIVHDCELIPVIISPSVYFGIDPPSHS